MKRRRFNDLGEMKACLQSRCSTTSTLVRAVGDHARPDALDLKNQLANTALPSLVLPFLRVLPASRITQDDESFPDVRGLIHLKHSAAICTKPQRNEKSQHSCGLLGCAPGIKSHCGERKRKLNSTTVAPEPHKGTLQA